MLNKRKNRDFKKRMEKICAKLWKAYCKQYVPTVAPWLTIADPVRTLFWEETVPRTLHAIYNLDNSLNDYFDSSYIWRAQQFYINGDCHLVIKLQTREHDVWLDGVEFIYDPIKLSFSVEIDEKLIPKENDLD